MSANPMASAAVMASVMVASRKRADKRKALAIGLASASFANPLAGVGLSLALNRPGKTTSPDDERETAEAQSAVDSASAAEDYAKKANEALALAKKAAAAANSDAKRAEAAARQALSKARQDEAEQAKAS